MPTDCLYFLNKSSGTKHIALKGAAPFFYQNSQHDVALPNVRTHPPRTFRPALPSTVTRCVCEMRDLSVNLSFFLSLYSMFTKPNI